MNEFPSWENIHADYADININGDIIFDNISFAYPARPDVLVLQNLSLIARAGEKTALVGWSGSGESSLQMQLYLIKFVF